MKFHNQMIVRAYDHTAQILQEMKEEGEKDTLKFPMKDKHVIYQAVVNDYRYKEIALNHIDFFYDDKYYDEWMSQLEIKLLVVNATAESNIILYHVNMVMDYMMEQLQKNIGVNQKFMNIGFVIIDIIRQQLIITDIENHICTRYQISVGRDLDNASIQANKGFSYLLRLKFISRCNED